MPELGEQHEYGCYPEVISEIHPYPGQITTFEVERVSGPQTKTQWNREQRDIAWEAQKRQYDEDYGQLKADIQHAVTKHRTINDAVDRILTIHAAWCDKYHAY